MNNIDIFSEVKKFCKLNRKWRRYLLKFPNRWSRFQIEFDSTIEKVRGEIEKIEKENNNKPKRLEKIKEIFKEKYRKYFLCGYLVKWSFEKPFGYPGDFKIIDEIYKNKPHTTGLDRLYDNHFLQLAASKATRERKDDFKKEIFNFINRNKNKKIRIMNLGSGSAREIKELLEENYREDFSKVIFDCYDFDCRAINYAKKLLGNPANVNFFEKNAIVLAFIKDIKREIPYEYDLIYSTGLFDYIKENFAVKLIANLKKILKKNGTMMISNYRERTSNPSACLMEWISEWYLIYRSEKEFQKIFIDAGFSQENLQIIPQKSKVMQYCLVTREE